MNTQTIHGQLTVPENFSRLQGRWQQESQAALRRSQEARALLAQHGPPLFQQFHIRIAILFGSALEGTMREDSDIDLMVDYLEPDQFFRFQCALEERLNVTVDLHTMDEDPVFVQKIKERGLLIHAT